MRNRLKLLLSILVTMGVGLSGGFFTAGEVNGWFTTIQKPGWNPPNWVFGPVWTILYLLMGIALYLVWKKPALFLSKKIALVVFAIQLLLNFLWSIFFFRLHNISLALADIIALWIFILWTIIAFSKISTRAAWLLVPYISWVSFATILNAKILLLN